MLDIWTKAATFSASALARLGNKLLASASTSTTRDDDEATIKKQPASPVAPAMSPVRSTLINLGKNASPFSLSSLFGPRHPHPTTLVLLHPTTSRSSMLGDGLSPIREALRRLRVRSLSRLRLGASPFVSALDTSFAASDDFWHSRQRRRRRWPDFDLQLSPDRRQALRFRSREKNRRSTCTQTHLPRNGALRFFPITKEERPIEKERSLNLVFSCRSLPTSVPLRRLSFLANSSHPARPPSRVFPDSSTPESGQGQGGGTGGIPANVLALLQQIPAAATTEPSAAEKEERLKKEEEERMIERVLAEAQGGSVLSLSLSLDCVLPYSLTLNVLYPDLKLSQSRLLRIPFRIPTEPYAPSSIDIDFDDILVPRTRTAATNASLANSDDVPSSTRNNSLLLERSLLSAGVQQRLDWRVVFVCTGSSGAPILLSGRRRRVCNRFRTERRAKR